MDFFANSILVTFIYIVAYVLILVILFILICRYCFNKRKFWGLIFIPILVSLFTNAFITYFSAPLLSMNLHDENKDNLNVTSFPTKFSRIINIENRGETIIGGRVILYIPREYIDNKSIDFRPYMPISREEAPKGYYRYQLDINAPIFYLRNIRIGEIEFSITDKNQKYNFNFEIFADKMAKRKGVIRVDIAEHLCSSASRPVIEVEDLAYFLLGRRRFW